MTQEKKSPFENRSRIFSFLCLLETLLTFIYIMAIPKSAKNAWLFGYSKTRFLMAAPVLLAAAILLWLCIQQWKQSSLAKNFLQNFKKLLTQGKLQFLADFSVLAAIMGTYILIKWWFFLDTGFGYQTTVQRITPYLLLVTVICVEVLFILYPRKEDPDSKTSTNFLEKIKSEILWHKSVPFVLAFFSLSFSLLHWIGLKIFINRELSNLYFFFWEEFNMDSENVLPTYFSGFIILLAALLLAVIAADKRKSKAPYSTQWILLSLIFFYLSLDEIFQLHENWNLPVSKLFSSDGYFFFSWVPSAMVILVIFAAIYARFFFHLPKKSILFFGLSGIIYVGGVLGGEMLAGEYISTFSEWGYDYGRLVILEETLEMLGITLFIYSLLDYIRQNLVPHRSTKQTTTPESTSN